MSVSVSEYRTSDGREGSNLGRFAVLRADDCQQKAMFYHPAGVNWDSPPLKVNIADEEDLRPDYVSEFQSPRALPLCDLIGYSSWWASGATFSRCPSSEVRAPGGRRDPGFWAAPLVLAEWGAGS